MIRAFSLLLLFCVIPAFGHQVSELIVDPLRPTTRDEVEIIVRGVSGDGCVPRAPRARITAGKIEIEMRSAVGCILIPTFWGERVRLGRVPAGPYDVVIRVDGNELSRRSLTVVDQPFIVAPSFGTAGDPVMLHGVPAALCQTSACLSSIVFGDVQATEVVGLDVDTIGVTAPTHAPGRVDVSFTDDAGVKRTVEDGFLYARPNDDVVGEHEKVLFPLNFEGSGANGAQWTTENWLFNGAPIPVILPHDEGVLDGGRERIVPGAADGGVFQYVPRDLEPWFSYASHIRDRSRVASDLGTAIPIVRRRDTASVLRFARVRLQPGYRAMLRIYDFDVVAGRVVDVTIRTANGEIETGRVVASATRVLQGGVVCVTTPCYQPSPAFSSIDLTALPALQGAHEVEVTLGSRRRDARLWALISITNNESQHVSIWTPSGVPDLQPPPARLARVR